MFTESGKNLQQKCGICKPVFCLIAKICRTHNSFFAFVHKHGGFLLIEIMAKCNLKEKQKMFVPNSILRQRPFINRQSLVN